MITIKNSAQIEKMREAGAMLHEVLTQLRGKIQPGVTTYELDQFAEKLIRSFGAIPSFLNYEGFPASICASVDNQVVHGIPSKNTVLKEGQIISVDCGLIHAGWQSDSAFTAPVGKVSEEAEKLIKVTRDSFFAGIERFQVGNRLGDIGHAIDSHVTANGFSTVKRYIGHGIGHDLHESPDVPNYGTEGRGTRLCAGLVLAIEPMVNIGGEGVKELSDGWTVKTADGTLSAHYENTVALTSEGIIIMTQLESDF